jgi:hypothetical protein
VRLWAGLPPRSPAEGRSAMARGDREGDQEARPGLKISAETASPASAANDKLVGALRLQPSSTWAKARDFASDATAVIERGGASVTQSGRAREKGWFLRSAPRRPYSVDPLTGWTGSDDPLSHLRLRFPTREAAIAYARRHGLNWRLGDDGSRAPRFGGVPVFQQSRPLAICCWPTGPHALCCGNYPVMRRENNESGS